MGSTLAAKLARVGHDVALVEADAGKAREFDQALDVQVVRGNGATAPVLRRASVQKADLLVATTDSDEVNMTVGLLATTLFCVARVVVRLRDPGRGDGFALLSGRNPANIVRVNPEAAAVDRIFALLEVPGAVDVVSFLNDQVVLAGFRIATSSDLAGLPLANMRLLFPATPTLVTAIQRGDTWIIPHGGEEICAGDLVYFSIAHYEVDDVVGLIGPAFGEPGRVMIAGASRIGLALAARFEKAGTSVVLVEATSSGRAAPRRRCKRPS